MINLNSTAFKIASFGKIGQWLTRSIVATAFAVVAVMLLNLLYSINEPTFYFLILGGFALCLIIIQMAYIHSYESTNMIVLDKFVGMMLALAQIPMTFKLVASAYLLFHLFNILTPFLVWKFYGKNMHNLPGAFGIIASDICAGLAVNMLLRFMLWVTN